MEATPRKYGKFIYQKTSRTTQKKKLQKNRMYHTSYVGLRFFIKNTKSESQKKSKKHLKNKQKYFENYKNYKF